MLAIIMLWQIRTSFITSVIMSPDSAWAWVSYEKEIAKILAMFNSGNLHLFLFHLTT